MCIRDRAEIYPAREVDSLGVASADIAVRMHRQPSVVDQALSLIHISEPTRPY